MSITMDDIRKRQRMCSDKSRFATEVDAKCFILKKRANLRAYQCPHCNDWHLTKKLTPPCATEGGTMSQTSYAPPPGRPISTPPMPNGHMEEPTPKARRPLASINSAGVIDDYIAGLKWTEIAKRRDCNVWHIAEIIKAAGLKKRNRKEEAAAPEPSEQPSGRPPRQEGESRGRYAARVLAWKRSTDPEYDKRVHQNMRRGQLRRARLARVQKAITSLADQARTPVAVDPPKPLTLWQRIVRWFA